MTRDMREEVLDIITTMWNALMADSKSKGAQSDDENMSSEASPNDLIVQSIDIHEKPSSYVGAVGGSKPEPNKSKENFRSLFSEICVKVKMALYRERLLNRLLLDLLIIYMDILLVNVLPFWLWNTMFEITGDDLKDSLTLEVPLIEGLRHTIETINIEYEWKPPCCDLCKIFGHVHDHFLKKISSPPTLVTLNFITHTIEKTNDGFQMVGKKKKKSKSKSTNGGQFGGPSVKQSVRKEISPCLILILPWMIKVRKTLKIVYDESANLFQSTKPVGSSSTFTAVGYLVLMIHLF
nr:hypothetical protein [Tanacetum cinerariifolium]